MFHFCLNCDYVYTPDIILYPIGCVWVANIVSSFRFKNISHAESLMLTNSVTRETPGVSVSSTVIYPPKINFDIFSRGTVISKGSRNVFSTLNALNFFKRKLELELNRLEPLYISDFRSANFVCTSKIGFCVDQEKLDIYKDAYKGEDFPTSGIFEPDTTMSCTISSDKVLICGASSTEHCIDAYNRYVGILEKFKLEEGSEERKIHKKRRKLKEKSMEDIWTLLDDE